MNDSNPPSIPETGDQIDDKYVLLRTIGKGGMGIVFEAKHRRLPGRVAIKFLLTSNWNGPRTTFEREIMPASTPSSRISHE